jgi:DNA replication protein DnaC
VPCALCDDTGWKTIDDHGVQRVTRCDCWYERLSKSLFESAQIPRRYRHCDLSNFETHTDSQRNAHQKALGFVEKFPVVDRGFLFYGDIGAGKTHLAVAIMKEVIRRKGARAIFYETTDLLKLVRNTYNNQVQSTELDVLRPVLQADLLVLDDLGEEAKSQWVEETLGLVINTRYSEQRATILTTNLVDIENTEPRSFAFQVGLRIRSRLKEMCEWIRIESHDTREVGPDSTHEQITRWYQESPASPKNRPRGGLPNKTSGQARAHLKRDRDARIDLKWPGGRAGS